MQKFGCLKMAKSLGATFSASSDEFDVISPPITPTPPIVTCSSLQNLCNSTSLCEIPTDEINARIGDLVKENLRLKDVLHEKNAHVQSKSKKSSEQEKAKLEDSRKIMSKLYEENTKLRRKLTTSKKAKKSHEEYEKKVYLLESENEKLKYVNKKLNDELKATKEELGSLTVDKHILSRDKVELLTTNAEQNDKINNLSKELDNYKIDRNLNTSNEYPNSLMVNLEYTRKRCPLENRLAECRDRLHDLNTKDSLSIKDLKMEIEHLNQIITEEQSSENIMCLNGVKKQIDNLLAEYKQLQHSWEMSQYEQVNKGVQLVVYKDIQVKGLKEEIDRLTAQVIANEETIASKDADNNQLSEQNRLLRQDIEKMSVLQAQLEIYQNDFRMEREAKDKLGQDKETAVQQVHQLEIRCEQLIKELDQYRPTRLPQRMDYAQERKIASCNQTTTDHRPIVTLQQTREPEVTTPIYTCPKCNMRFSELPPLENHVNYCLDEVDDDPYI